MGIFSTVATSLLAASLVSAQGDPNARLTKPPLRANLDYLANGLIQYLPERGFSYAQWSAGYVPQECVTIANNWAGVNPKDFQVFNIQYDDVCALFVGNNLV